MSGEKYSELAAVALRDAFNAGIVAQLAAIESAEALAVGIPRPLACLVGRLPNDNRSPLPFVYAETATVQVQRNRVMHVECMLGVQLVASSVRPADLETLELNALRYGTAILELIRTNATLTQRVAGAEVLSFETGGLIEGQGDTSTTKLAIGASVLVMVQS